MLLLAWSVLCSADLRLCSLTLALSTRTSAGNCAAIYNEQSEKHDPLRRKKAAKFELRIEQIWDAFTVLALLEDAASFGPLGVLMVPHAGLQADRYRQAMHQRNLRFRTVGQPEAEALLQAVHARLRE